MEIVVPMSDVTFDASEKTITLGGDYSTVLHEQISRITNLTTGDLIYNSEDPNKYSISMASDVITHTYDNSRHNDTDSLQIVVILSDLSSLWVDGGSA